MIIAKPYVEHGSIFKKRRPVRLIMFFAFLTPILILVSHNHRQSLPPSLYLKLCGHIVLVTGPRHGSTWFISCAEGCPSKDRKKFRLPNGHTELWVEHRGDNDVVGDLSPESAVDYVQHNMSLKIMPLTAKREDELKKFFGLMDNSVPVFLLRRNLEDAYSSLLEAKETRAWMTNNVNLEKRITSRKLVKDEEYFAYEGSVTRFFEHMSTFMREAGIVWDEIDYEEAVRSRTIVAEKQGCYITNCNYL